MLEALLADVAAFSAATAVLIGEDWMPLGGVVGLALWVLDARAARRRARESAILGAAPSSGRARRSR